ncbi:MAG TPA: ribonuclease H-like domain-containing protein [Planctomycetota bacterium]|jgi:uncharacterized protein YprB with RNaseH-like and TPR domain
MDGLENTLPELPPPPRNTSDDVARAELRRKLDSLRAGVTGGAPPEVVGAANVPATLPPLVFSRDLPYSLAQRKPALPPLVGPPVRLEDAVPGREVRTPDGLVSYLIEQCCEERISAVRADHFTAQASALSEYMARRNFHAAIQPEDLLFVDLETAGLASAPLFLIGTLCWENAAWVLRQYLCRDYSEERCVLALFMELAAKRKVLVSFNGKSFDVPFVRMRAAANGVPCCLDHFHLDLLHAARRVWKGRLPDCRLQTLERHVCGRLRGEDIPSHQIPDVYHAFVRTGNARQLSAVIRHNRFDLITLADLLVRISAEPAKRPSVEPGPREEMLWAD